MAPHARTSNILEQVMLNKLTINSEDNRADREEERPLNPAIGYQVEDKALHPFPLLRKRAGYELGPRRRQKTNRASFP